MGTTQSSLTVTAYALLVSSAGAFSIPPAVTPQRTSAAAAAFVGAPRPSFAATATTSALWARRGGGGGRKRYQKREVEEKPTMNNEITAPELRVMLASSSGGKDEALGILSRADALAKAKEIGGLDLILINDKSDPPVCKIVDYSKYRYMKEKKAKEVKKNSKASELKEVKMSYKIDVHDYEVRRKSALKFISQGNRVKCSVVFRGREVQHDKLGYELLDKLALDLEKVCTKEGRPKREGRNLFCILAPRAEVLKAVTEGKRNQEKAKKKKKAESFKEKQDTYKDEGEELVIASAVGATALADEQDILSALSTGILDGDDEDGDDGEDDAGEDGDGEVNLDDDDDVASSLDALLGSDDLTDELFN